jgi:hypothetical protein
MQYANTTEFLASARRQIGDNPCNLMGIIAIIAGY